MSTALSVIMYNITNWTRHGQEQTDPVTAITNWTRHGQEQTEPVTAITNWIRHSNNKLNITRKTGLANTLCSLKSDSCFVAKINILYTYFRYFRDLFCFTALQKKNIAFIIAWVAIKF
jgi:hypothetical protein